MTQREPLSSEIVRYTTTRWDYHWEEICERYDLDYATVAQLNPGMVPTGGERSRHPIHGTFIVNLPIPLDLFDYEWERVVMPAGTRLEDTPHHRTDHPDTAAPADQGRPRTGARFASAPWPSPEYLWHCILNHEWRNQWTTEAHEAHEARMRGGIPLAGAPPFEEPSLADLPRLSIHVDEVLWVPWPRRATGRAISVAPTPGGEASGPTGNARSCTTCSPVPDWVDELWTDHLVPIERATFELSQHTGGYRNALQAFQRELAMLNSVETLLNVMADCGGTHVDALKAELREVSDAFGGAAGRWPGMSGARALERSERVIYGRARTRHARDLMRRLRAPSFNELVHRAFIEEDVVVNEQTTVQGAICSLVADACAKVVQVGAVAHELERLIDQALERHLRDGAGETLRRGDDAIDTVLSLARSDVGLQESYGAADLMDTATTLSGIGTTVAGNLPGPPSLAGALLQLRLQGELPQLSAAIRQGRLSAGFLELRVGELAALGRMTRGEVEAALRLGPDGDGELISRITSRYQSGAGWCSALAVVSLLGLLWSASNMPDDPFDPHSGTAWALWVTDIAGGSINSFSSFVGMLGHFGEGGRWERFCTGLGNVGAGIAVAAGLIRAYRAYQQSDLPGGIIAVASVAGGVLLFFEGPWGALGAVVVTACAVASAVLDEIRNGPDTRKTVLALLEQFEGESQRKIHALVSQSSTLRQALDRFVHSVTESDAFVGLIEPPPGSGIGGGNTAGERARRQLEALRVNATVIDSFITTNMSTMGWALDPRFD
ncbi:MAG: hypothetical protein KC731_07675 [Myxococcales bacterium]|nr:hypothetical protein [Myxococcales bacterium]